MPNVMGIGITFQTYSPVPNIGGALCFAPQSFADAQY